MEELRKIETVLTLVYLIDTLFRRHFKFEKKKKGFRITILF